MPALILKPGKARQATAAAQELHESPPDGIGCEPKRSGGCLNHYDCDGMRDFKMTILGEAHKLGTYCKTISVCAKHADCDGITYQIRNDCVLQCPFTARATRFCWYHGEYCKFFPYKPYEAKTKEEEKENAAQKLASVFGAQPRTAKGSNPKQSASLVLFDLGETKPSKPRSKSRRRIGYEE